jgi:hypothetical protein
MKLSFDQWTHVMILKICLYFIKNKFIFCILQVTVYFYHLHFIVTWNQIRVLHCIWCPVSLMVLSVPYNHEHVDYCCCCLSLLWSNASLMNQASGYFILAKGAFLSWSSDPFCVTYEVIFRNSGPCNLELFAVWLTQWKDLSCPLETVMAVCRFLAGQITVD